jgi:Ni/Co efflux regulator RcnB
MLKTISAALVAASLVAAPAMAATAVKAPAAKTETTKAQTHTMKKSHHRHRAELRHPQAHKHAGAVTAKKTAKKHVSSGAPAAKHVVAKKKV